jgi:hypothetical protein
MSGNEKCFSKSGPSSATITCGRSVCFNHSKLPLILLANRNIYLRDRSSWSSNTWYESTNGMNSYNNGKGTVATFSSCNTLANAGTKSGWDSCED